MEKNTEKNTTKKPSEESFFEEINPEMKALLSKYSPEVQETFLQMIASLDAVKELQRLTNTYDKSRELFTAINVKQRREMIIELVKSTYVETYEELAMLLSVETSEITSLLKGKTALKKNAELYIKRNRQTRITRQKFFKSEEVAETVAEKVENAGETQTTAEETEKIIPWQRFYYVRDGVSIWSSHISKTSRSSEVLLDTNILIDVKSREYVEKHFQRGAVSMISVMELRQLLKTNRDIAMRALSNLMQAVNHQIFYKPVCDTTSDLTGDCDIKLVKLAAKNDYTFVTMDMGAAVYAWSISCPCRYLRTDPVVIDRYSGAGATPKIAILDVDTKANKLNNMLRYMYSHVIITDLFAMSLNRNKRSDEAAVTALQEDICTDTNGFYEPYLMNVKTKDCAQYEMELIEICKERKAVLVSSNPETLALAWEHGIETFYKN